MGATARPRIHVVAGVLRDTARRVLICERPAGKHMAGSWEFPGGKRHAGESPRAALARELEEELGVLLHDARPLIRYTHDYPDRIVDLDVWMVADYAGRPVGREDQRLEWLPVDELCGWPLLPADRPIVNAIALGSLYVVTGSFDDQEDFRIRLTDALDRGAGLVQIRMPAHDRNRLADYVTRAVRICRRRRPRVRVVINGDPAITAPVAVATGADGLHLPARHTHAALSGGLPDGLLLGASCHDAEELRRAVAIGADYAILGPVRETASHPGAPGLGWDRFARLVAPLAMPVYGIGGLEPGALSTAWEHGAQGIAAITSLWS